MRRVLRTSRIRAWRRRVCVAMPLLLTAACGESASSNGEHPGAGGASAGTGGSTTNGAGGEAASGAVGTAWFEVLEPLPAVLEPGTDPSAVSNETELFGASLDGSVLIGGSWMLVKSGLVQQRNAGFTWTRAAGIVDLGHLGAVEPNPLYIFPLSVSHDGDVVVGTSGPGLGVPIFRWTEATGMVDLGTLEGATSVTLDDVRADGNVIVGTAGDRGFRWTPETGMVALDSVAGMDRASSLRLSGDGQIVFGTVSSSTESVTFRWSAADGIELLEAPCRLAPGGVSRDGSSFVGLCTTADGLGPYQWSRGGGLMSLGAAPSGYNVDLASASGEHAVLIAHGHGNNREDYQALRATAATGFVALGALPENPSCSALGGSFDGFSVPRSPMNADGSVVAGNCLNTAAGTALGFRWSEGAGLTAMKPLAGHVRTRVTSVSPDGILGGTSSDGDTETEGVLWDENGEPRSIRALLAEAGVAVANLTLDDVVVLRGGRLLYGRGRDAARQGRAWVALLP